MSDFNERVDAGLETEAIELAPDLPAGKGIGRTRGTILLACAKAMNGFLSLFAVKIYLRSVGDAGYGATIYAGVVIGYVALLDPGIAEAVQRKLSVVDWTDRKRVNALQGTHFAYLLAFTAILLLSAVAVGLFGEVPKSGLGRFETISVFVLVAMSQALANLTSLPDVVFFAKNMFQESARRALGIAFLTTGASVILVLLYPHPSAILAGVTLGSAYNFGAAIVRCRTMAGESLPRPHFDRSVLKEIFQLVGRDLGNRVTSVVSATGDRLVLGSVLGATELSKVQLSGRLPEAAGDTLFSLAYVSSPKLSRLVQEDPIEFQAEVERSGRFTLAVGFGLVMVTAGFSGPFLHLWLGNRMPEVGPLLMLMYGFYRAFQLYYGFLARVFYSAEAPQYATPIYIINAAATIGLAIPFIHVWGLVGLGYLNALISLVLLGPQLYVLKRRITPQLAVLSHLAKVMGIVLVGTSIAVGSYWLTTLGPLKSHPFIGMCLLPLACALAVGLMVGLKLVPLPDSLQERLNKFRRSSPAS